MKAPPSSLPPPLFDFSSSNDIVLLANFTLLPPFELDFEDAVGESRPKDGGGEGEDLVDIDTDFFIEFIVAIR
jgi:hypothetical protein